MAACTVVVTVWALELAELDVDGLFEDELEDDAVDVGVDEVLAA